MTEDGSSIQGCQLHESRQATERLRAIDRLLQIRVVLLRKGKREAIYLKNRFKRLLSGRKVNDDFVTPPSVEIEPGSVVRVKSAWAIRTMLDDHNKQKGCLFIDEMYQYCGRTFKVFKRVESFFDDAKNKMCKASDTVILDGIRCSGKQRLYLRNCDRGCFFFWLTDWLEPVEDRGVAD